MDFLGQPMWIGFFLGILVGGVLFNRKFRDSVLSFLFPKYRKQMMTKSNSGYGNIEQNNTNTNTPMYATYGQAIIDQYTGTNYHLDWNCPNVQPKDRYVAFNLAAILEMKTFRGGQFKPCPICVRGS